MEQKSTAPGLSWIMALELGVGSLCVREMNGSNTDNKTESKDLPNIGNLRCSTTI